MRLREKFPKSGHLISYSRKSDRNDNFSFFFPIEGLDQFDYLLVITKGFNNCLETFTEEYGQTEYSVAEFGNLKNVLPEIDQQRISIFETEEFLTEQSDFNNAFGTACLTRNVLKSKPLFPAIYTGAIATGSSFYNRQAKISEIWRIIKDGNNILLRAPRRYGKSSLLQHLASHPEAGWQVCFIDLEGGKSPEDFVEAVLASFILGKDGDCTFCLPNHLIDLELDEKTELEKVDIIRQERKKINNDWIGYAEDLLDSIADKIREDEFVLVLDEISFLMEDMLEFGKDAVHSSGEFLQWFRQCRNRSSKIRFILSGSEHLPSFLESYEIEGFLEDLTEVHIDLFDSTTVKDFIFLVLAGQGIVIKENEINEILTLLGNPIPYFLQLFLDTLTKRCKEIGELSNEEIRNLYFHDLLGASGKRSFESIVKQLERYNRYNNSFKTGAEKVLDRIAQDESPSLDILRTLWQEATNESGYFNTILSIMQDDFYLKLNDSQQVYFESKIIRDWWIKHHLTHSK